MKNGIIFFVELDTPTVFNEYRPIFIGHTAKDVRKTVLHIQSCNPYKVIMVGCYAGSDTLKSKICKQFSCLKIRQRGSWYKGDESLIKFIEDMRQGSRTYKEYQRKYAKR